MALLLLAVFVAVMRAQGVRSYSHTLGVKARGVAGGVSQHSDVRVDLGKVAIVLAIFGFVAAAAVFGQDPMVFVAAIGRSSPVTSRGASTTSGARTGWGRPTPSV